MENWKQQLCYRKSRVLNSNDLAPCIQIRKTQSKKNKEFPNPKIANIENRLIVN